MESYNHKYTENKTTTTTTKKHKTLTIHCSTYLFTVVMQIKSFRINATDNPQALAQVHPPSNRSLR